MRAIAKVGGGNTVHHIPSPWNRDDAHTLHVVPVMFALGPDAQPAQRSFPLFRVMRVSFTVNAASNTDNSVLSPETAPVSAFSEQPPALTPPVIFLEAQTAVRPKPSRRRHWSDDHVGLLLSDYPTFKPVRDICAELGRSVGAIYGKARRLNLRRPPRQAGQVDHAAQAPIPDFASELAQPHTDPAPQFSLPQLPAPPPASKQEAKRTKLGGRHGRWTRDDGALSVRLERLYIAGFHDTCIATILGVSSGAVWSRAWSINCPHRDPKALRHDIEAARLVDRQATPLPQTAVCWKLGKPLTRRRCNIKGEHFWADRGSRFSNDARRLPLFASLGASEPLHVW